MPFERPTLLQLKQQAAADLDAELAGTDATLRRANTAVLATVLAGGEHGLHGHLASIARQIFTATQDETELLRDAAAYGLTPNPATCASGIVLAPGDNGAIVPQGSVWLRSDGAEYSSSADATVVDGIAAVPVRATLAGLDGNTAPAAVLTLSTTEEGIEGTGVVDEGGIRGGSDQEDIEQFRLRVQEYKRKKPSGGNRHDYIRWAKSIAGIAAAWVVHCGQGPGTVDVVCLADAGITGSIYPDAELLAEVRAFIVLQCPDNAKYLRVLAPTPRPIDVTLSVTPDTVAVRGQVEVELADLATRYADPALRLASVEITIPLSQINEAVSLAAGETDHAITIPAAPLVISGYELPVPGVVTWA